MNRKPIHSSTAAHPARLQLPPPPRRRSSVWREKEPGCDPELADSIIRRATSIAAHAEAIVKENELLRAIAVKLAASGTAIIEDRNAMEETNRALRAALENTTAELQSLICPTNKPLK